MRTLFCWWGSRGFGSSFRSSSSFLTCGPPVQKEKRITRITPSRTMRFDDDDDDDDKEYYQNKNRTTPATTKLYTRVLTLSVANTRGGIASTMEYLSHSAWGLRTQSSSTDSGMPIFEESLQSKRR